MNSLTTLNQLDASVRPRVRPLPIPPTVVVENSIVLRRRRDGGAGVTKGRQTFNLASLSRLYCFCVTSYLIRTQESTPVR